MYNSELIQNFMKILFLIQVFNLDTIYGVPRKDFFLWFSFHLNVNATSTSSQCAKSVNFQKQYQDQNEVDKFRMFGISEPNYPGNLGFDVRWVPHLSITLVTTSKQCHFQPAILV